MGVLDEKLYCVMCGGEVPADRRKRRSITCSDGCKKERTAYLHRRVERTRCRYCAQPVTPEESRRYRTWRKYEAIVTASNPKYSDELREFIDALYVKIPKLPGAKKVDMPEVPV